MNDREELARLLPVPGERDLPAGRKQILKEHLMTELRQPSTRRTRKSRTRTIRLGARHPRRLAAAAGLAAAAITATAVAVAVVMTAGTAPPGPGAGPAGTPRT